MRFCLLIRLLQPLPALRGLVVVLLLGATFSARAQDVIIGLDGTETPGQVVEITPTQVFYRTADADPALPPAILDKKTLFMIKFANGSKEVFGVASQAPASAVAPTPGVTATPPPMSQDAELEMRGRLDAERLYPRTGAFWGTVAATTVGYGFVVPAVVIGAVRPRAYKNPNLDQRLLQYPSYVRGYERRAHQRKAWPVIGGYLLGCVGAAILYGTLTQ